MDISTLVTERIDKATPSENKWNSWPSDMEFVSVRRLDLAKPRAAYEAGKLMGYGVGMGTYRQVRADNIPKKVAAEIPLGSLAHTWFILAHPRGQDDDMTKRNLLAVFEEGTWGNEKVVVVEIGCNHVYITEKPFPCYVEGKCERCGHKYTCDSGD